MPKVTNEAVLYSVNEAQNTVNQLRQFIEQKFNEITTKLIELSEKVDELSYEAPVPVGRLMLGDNEVGDSATVVNVGRQGSSKVDADILTSTEDNLKNLRMILTKKLTAGTETFKRMIINKIFEEFPVGQDVGNRYVYFILLLFLTIILL